MFEQERDRWDSREHGLAIDCVTAGIERARPRNVVAREMTFDDDTLRIDGATYDLGAYDDVFVVGGGNAAGHVAAALEELLGDRITAGVVVTDDPVETDRIDVLEGDHPVPSQTGVENTRKLRRVVDDAGPQDLVLVIVAGGGSALMTAPVDGVALDDVRRTTTALLESGAAIDRINAVRKHLSAVKGGRLAAAAAPATVVGIVFSDVVGDDLATIASGPTAPDETTFADALHVLETYDVTVPAAVRDRLEAGSRGDVDETPDVDSPAFDDVTNHVVVTGYDAVAGAAEHARDEGVDALVLSSTIRGEAREAALSHVGIVEETIATGNPVDPPVVLVSGGETTVTVRGDGEGGPNQEFALSTAVELPEGAVLASVDTDGIDGATDAAGALVDPSTVDDERMARAALADNDAYGYLSERDALLRSGPTGTNVNDLRVAVVGRL